MMAKRYPKTFGVVFDPTCIFCATYVAKSEPYRVKNDHNIVAHAECYNTFRFKACNHHFYDYFMSIGEVNS